MNKDIILNEFGRVSEAMGWDALHSPKNLSATLAVEAAKLLDNFRLMSDVESEMIDEEPIKKAIADDLADVLIYITVLSHKLDMDPWSVVKDKLLSNREKYIDKLTEEKPSRISLHELDVRRSVGGQAYMSRKNQPVANQQPAEHRKSEWESMAKRIANSREEVRAASVRLRSEKLK